MSIFLSMLAPYALVRRFKYRGVVLGQLDRTITDGFILFTLGDSVGGPVNERFLTLYLSDTALPVSFFPITHWYSIRQVVELQLHTLI